MYTHIARRPMTHTYICVQKRRNKTNAYVDGRSEVQKRRNKTNANVHRRSEVQKRRNKTNSQFETSSNVYPGLASQVSGNSAKRLKTLCKLRRPRSHIHASWLGTLSYL